MAEQHKPDLSKVEPISTWGDEEQPRGGPGGANRRADLDPIPGTPATTPLVDSPFEREPETSPETDQELDQLRRA